LVRKVIKLQI